MAYFDPTFARPQNPDNRIPYMSMDEIHEKLCAKSEGDPLACIDCEPKCPYGKRAVELIEKETKNVSIMNKKQLCDVTRRLTAMSNYLEAMSKENPVQFIMQKYGCSKEPQARQKIHSWKHIYGGDMLLVATQVNELQNMVSNAQIVDKPEKRTSESCLLSVQELDHPTKRQEEKISQSCLERTRRDLENDILKAEEEISEHEKAIQACKNRMEDNTQKIQAIRQVLEIFSRKDKIYV